MKRIKKEVSRRRFLQSAAGVAGFTIVPRCVLGGRGYTAPNERLNIACIGVGGKGAGDVGAVSSENIVALCDVDEVRAAGTFKRFANVKKYRDFRRMLEELDSKIDAVTVSTPDHVHYPAAMMAVRMKKHVYCQKPLTHSVVEARRLTEASRRAGVATQMGIDEQANEGSRLLCEWIWDGAIGEVREVHAWTNRPVWPQGIDRPKETPPVPATLAWDLWLGPAPYRPYHPAYAPSNWRGWVDFGCGALGDMGCHIFDPVFRALKLGHPTIVEASSTKVNSETFPLASIVHYEFPARAGMPPVKLTWYDGGLRPARPEELEPGRRFSGDIGSLLFVGETGKILMSSFRGGPRLIPEAKMQVYERPARTIPRSIGHYREWLEACKGGQKAGANFDYGGPLTEVVLLGNVAIRTGKKLDWDGPNMKVTNVPEANEYLHRPYCGGWSL
jgi:predicted dehydrogenase